jgi:hypothetical protein
LPYPRLFGVPAVVIALAAIGTVLILVFVASRVILRWSRRSLTKPMPAYPVSVNGQQYQLDQFPDRVVRWTPWFLASRYVDGAAIGAPGLRFGTDRRGTARYVAGAGAVNGKPLGRWRGTALADGDLVELRGRAAGVRVLVGSAYGDLPMYPGVAADNWEPAYASSEAPGQGYGSVGTPAYGGELDGGRFDI